MILNDVETVLFNGAEPTCLVVNGKVVWPNRVYYAFNLTQAEDIISLIAIYDGNGTQVYTGTFTDSASSWSVPSGYSVLITATPYPYRRVTAIVPADVSGYIVSNSTYIGYSGLSGDASLDLHSMPNNFTAYGTFASPQPDAYSRQKVLPLTITALECEVPYTYQAPIDAMLSSISSYSKTGAGSSAQATAVVMTNLFSSPLQYANVPDVRNVSGSATICGSAAPYLSSGYNLRVSASLDGETVFSGGIPYGDWDKIKTSTIDNPYVYTVTGTFSAESAYMGASKQLHSSNFNSNLYATVSGYWQTNNDRMSATVNSASSKVVFSGCYR